MDVDWSLHVAICASCMAQKDRKAGFHPYFRWYHGWCWLDHDYNFCFKRNIEKWRRITTRIRHSLVLFRDQLCCICFRRYWCRATNFGVNRKQRAIFHTSHNYIVRHLHNLRLVLWVFCVCLWWDGVQRWQILQKRNSPSSALKFASK